MTTYRRDVFNKVQLQLPWSPGASMSTEAVATILHCSSETVRAMLDGGELVGYQLRKVKGSPWRVYKDSVARRLKEICDGLELNESEFDLNETRVTATGSAKRAKPEERTHRDRKTVP